MHNPKLKGWKEEGIRLLPADNWMRFSSFHMVSQTLMPLLAADPFCTRSSPNFQIIFAGFETVDAKVILFCGKRFVNRNNSELEFERDVGEGCVFVCTCMGVRTCMCLCMCTFSCPYVWLLSSVRSPFGIPFL